MQRVEILLDAIKGLSKARDMEAVTRTVKTAARNLSDADGATFILKENEVCYYVDEDAISPLWKGKRFTIESCISGWVMQNGKPAVIEDIFQDKRVSADIYQPTFVKSLVLVPIRSANPLGAIGIYWGRKYKASPEVVELLQSLADSTAIAIENIGGYIVDISEQKNIEKELEQSEEKYRLLFANNPQPMWIYDLETLDFLEVNQAAVNHYGYLKKEFLSMTLKDIRPVEDIPAMLEDIKKTRSDFNTDGARRHLKKNGEIIDVEIISQSVVYNNRKARHILINDITERKRVIEDLKIAKEKAEASEAKYEAAFRTSPDSVNINKMNGEFIEINEGFIRLTGYTEKDVIGKLSSAINIWHVPGDREKLIDGLKKNGIVENLESLFRAKDGTLIPALMSAKIIYLNNEPHTLSVTRAIVERKKMEQELINAKEKAEESDRLKSAFLANMSHEIRTPMNGILGFTELLLEPDLSNKEKEAYINIVNQSGQRMLSTVNDIIEISKIEAGIVTIDLKEVDVQEHLDELIRFFTPEATKKGLRLTLEEKVPTTVSVILADKNKLDSILTNLIKNALKFTTTGTIKVGCTIVETQDLASLQFYVKDTGIGIPAERQQAVFNRFVQADIEDTRAFEGSGLGLSITKAYVEMLGGKIWLKSREGNLPAGKAGGSTFYFTLPLTN